jgi:hypothetical protein
VFPKPRPRVLPPSVLQSQPSFFVKRRIDHRRWLVPLLSFMTSLLCFSLFACEVPLSLLLPSPLAHARHSSLVLSKEKPKNTLHSFAPSFRFYVACEGRHSQIPLRDSFGFGLGVRSFGAGGHMVSLHRVTLEACAPTHAKDLKEIYQQ